jgi:hypothetical protein
MVFRILHLTQRVHQYLNEEIEKSESIVVVRVFSTQYDICHCVENDPEREEQEELTCC